MRKTAAAKLLTSEFENVALQHLDAVYRAAYALAGRRETAEDLAQTTFVKAMEHFGSFDMNSNCKAWLLRILRNTWIDQLRRMRIAGPAAPLCESIAASGTEQDSVWSNPQDLLENFADEQVIGALSRLADEQRLTIFLVDVEGLSHEEVAEITGVAVGTVKSRTSRARAALKNCLAARAREMGWAGERRWTI